MPVLNGAQFALILAGLALNCSVARANDIYLAQNASGLRNGSDCADAYSYTFFNQSGNWGSGGAQIGPGTTAHICGTVTNQLVFQGDGRSGSPITLLFEPDAVLSSPSGFANGFIYGGSGIRNWITIDGGTNGLIQGTNNGSAPTYATQIDAGGVYFPVCNNCIVRNLHVTNLFVKSTNDGQGGGDGIDIHAGINSSIYNNVVHDANACIYAGFSSQYPSSGLSIYGNTLYRCNWGIGMGDANANAVLNTLSIHNNEIYDAGIWDDSATNQFHHNGIILFVTNLGSQINSPLIYNNYIHGEFGSRETAHIFLDNEGGLISNAQIFNNVLVNNSASNSPTNGFVMNKVGSASALPGHAQIYNNTFYNITASGGLCLRNSADTNERLENNIFVNCGTAVLVDGNGSLAVSDYNDFYGTTVNTLNYPTGAYNSLAAVRAATGFETHSIAANPNLNAAFQPQSGSPVIGQGIDLSSLSSIPLTFDYAARARLSGQWDMGAVQAPDASRGLVVPNAPSGLRVTVR